LKKLHIDNVRNKLNDTYWQGYNLNEKTVGDTALLSFSCSLMFIDICDPYNSTVTKIFVKYINISKCKLFTLIFARITCLYYPSVNINVSLHDRSQILSEVKGIMVL
jgi:hypothetical protein